MAKGALGIEDKIPAEWADWRANQRVFEDTSMLDSGLMSDPWRYGGDGGGGVGAGGNNGTSSLSHSSIFNTRVLFFPPHINLDI